MSQLGNGQYVSQVLPNCTKINDTVIEEPFFPNTHHLQTGSFP